MQFKTAQKLTISILLVALLVLTYCLGCNFSFAYAEETTRSARTVSNATEIVLTYKVSVDGGAYEIRNISFDSSFNHPELPDVPKYRRDAWYLDEARTQKAPSTANRIAVSATLYGAYVFDVGMGDVNADGIVNIDDTTLYRKYIVGGYKMRVVEKGKEWEYFNSQDYKDDASTDASKKQPCFLKRVADVYADTECDVRDIAETRMAIASGYGMTVNSSVGVTGQEIGEPVTYNTLYYFNKNNWDNVYCHAWNSEQNNGWVAMNPVDKHLGWYSVTIPSAYTSILFAYHNSATNDNFAQTADLTINPAKPYYDGSKWTNAMSMVRIYFCNSANWNEPHIHMWKDGGASTSWNNVGGPQMTWAFGSWFYYDLDKNLGYEDVIFSDKGSDYNRKQSKINYTNSCFNNGSWVATNPKNDFTRIYFHDYDSWGTVNIYMWGSSSNNGWNGPAMTNMGNGWFCYDVERSKNFTNVIFNHNGSTTQRNETTLNFGAQFYTGSKWSNVAQKVYFYNQYGWSKVYMHAWGSKSNDSWTGTPSNGWTQIYPISSGSKWYTVNVSDSYSQIMFASTTTDIPFMEQTANLSLDGFSNPYFFDGIIMSVKSGGKTTLYNVGKQDSEQYHITIDLQQNDVITFYRSGAVYDAFASENNSINIANGKIPATGTYKFYIHVNFSQIWVARS